LPALVQIRAALGPDVPLIYDGAVRSGTDVLRAIALGANLVMLGRGFHYGVAAAGLEGARQVVHVMSEELRLDMAQLGINRPSDARGRARVEWNAITTLP
jgi:L-lactate dehydrogenase (cytochrome)